MNISYFLDSKSSKVSLKDDDDEEEEDINDPHIDKLWGIHEKIDKLRGNMSKQNLNEDLSDEHTETDDIPSTSIPETYIVLTLSTEIKGATLKWLIEKIRGKRRDGGAELVLFKQSYDENKGLVLHVTATNIKFLETAEEMEIIKIDRNGQSREFIVNQLEEFLPDGMHVDDLFSTYEKQSIVKHELDNIRALPEDDHVPGYNDYNLYEGQSIIQACIQNELIEQMFPLHESELLKKLGKKWYLSLLRKQPLEEIRLYFGDAIALYFVFLGFYTTALLIPVFLGFLQLLVSSETMPFFCIFNVVWVTVFLEVWKRRCNELAFKWGTIGMTSLDEPRANYRGHMGYDAVTGRLQPQYPRWKTNVKMYCVSIPIVFLCMLIAFFVMLTSFWVEDYIKSIGSNWAVNIPSILYTGLVYVMNVYYRKLATYLTEWENHRTQSQYDRHMVSKLVLFEFVNNFLSLFYIAFVIQDMDMLRNQLATMLIILQAINNLQETVMPFVTKVYMNKVQQLKDFIYSKTSKTRTSKFHYTETGIYKDSPFPFIQDIPDDDTRVLSANKESDMESYEGTFDDYLEMFVQFGYVVLFSSVYPIAAFWAVFNNVLEIRADAFKLCMVYQRPMGKKVKDIGAWQKAFEMLGALSIMTNCGLLCLSPQMKRTGSDLNMTEWILLFVLLEHFLLGLRYLLHIAIADKPEWVRVALAKRNYESKQALKHERALKNRKILTRRFKTVHGPHKY